MAYPRPSDGVRGEDDPNGGPPGQVRDALRVVTALRHARTLRPVLRRAWLVPLVLLTMSACGTTSPSSSSDASSPSSGGLRCAGPVTSNSGPPSYQAALADSSLCAFELLNGVCGSYVTLFAYPASGGIDDFYYYNAAGTALVAVVQENQGPGGGDARTCVAGPSTFVEPPGVSFMNEAVDCLNSRPTPTAECSGAGG
jgi:hypothetical protein